MVEGAPWIAHLPSQELQSHLEIKAVDWIAAIHTFSAAISSLLDISPFQAPPLLRGLVNYEQIGAPRR